MGAVRRMLGAACLAALCAALAGCAAPPESDSGETRPPEPGTAAERSAPAPGTPGPASPAPLVVFLGDSLTAGLGVAGEEAFPALIEARLAASGVEIRGVNAGISGDTTAGGLARLDWLLGQRPDVLVVGLGANDGLRGLSLEQTEANLRAILDRSRRAGCEVLLLGMRLPPNYGADYTERFAAIFPGLARELDVPLVPFLLGGVAGRPELNQADGIHPTAEGHRLMAENVLPQLRALLPAAGTPG